MVDASALAASIFREAAAPEVVERIGDSTLAAPGVLRFEIANVALKKLKEDPDQRDRILWSLDNYGSLDIREVSSSPHGIARLAEETKLSAHDAAYLHAAILLDAPLVTLDKKLAAAARRILNKKD